MLQTFPRKKKIKQKLKLCPQWNMFFLFAKFPPRSFSFHFFASTFKKLHKCIRDCKESVFLFSFSFFLAHELLFYGINANLIWQVFRLLSNHCIRTAKSLTPFRQRTFFCYIFLCRFWKKKIVILLAQFFTARAIIEFHEFLMFFTDLETFDLTFNFDFVAKFVKKTWKFIRMKNGSSSWQISSFFLE